MIKFFRDVLSGPLYVIVVLLSIILIMAIIGFMLERKQKEKEEKDKITVVGQDRPNPENSSVVEGKKEIPVFNKENYKL